MVQANKGKRSSFYWHKEKEKKCDSFDFTEFKTFSVDVKQADSDSLVTTWLKPKNIQKAYIVWLSKLVYVLNVLNHG
jgi:hypothetical protein